MKTDFLPVKVHRVGRHKFKLTTETAITLAASRLCETILLLDALVQLSTSKAAEGANVKLRFNFSRASHSARNAHNLAQVEGLKVTDFLHTRQVVDANLEPLSF